MDLNDLKQEIIAAAVAKLLGQTQTAPATTHPLTGKFVIVRGTASGVHAGYADAIGADSVLLRAGSFRLWQWHSNMTTGALHGLAKSGMHPTKGRVEKSAGMVDVRDVAEVIEVDPSKVETFTARW